MRISCNSKQIDIPLIHRFLSEESQWAKGISLPVVEKAIKNSLCFAGYVGSNQMAFARVVSDYATFAKPQVFMEKYDPNVYTVSP